MNEWDGVIAVEEDATVDNRRIVAGALEFEDVLPVALPASEHDYLDRLKGRTTSVRRDGKLIVAEGVVDAPPGAYSSSIAVSSKGRTLFRVYQDPERGTYTIQSGDIMEVMLIPVEQAVWPEASITVYDGKRPSSEADEVSRDDQVRNLLGMVDTWLENGSATKHYRDDPTVFQCEHGGELHVGWRELSDEAMRAQALLDFFDVQGGMPQGKGDLDWRVAEALLELSEARSVLSDIAAAHARETAGGGMVGDFCVECDYRWPCPTYLRAAGERTSDTPWLPQDDDA